MARPSTGTVRWMRPASGGAARWHARWTRADGTRTNWIPLPDEPRLLEHDRAGAKAVAARFAETARATVKGGRGETVATYAARWLADREGRVQSVADDRARLRLHALPILGPLEARTFTRDDVERVRDELDAKIVRGELAWKTSASVWTLVTSMCADMVTAKRREFRVREDNPAREVKPPERGARKAKQYLYPSEFLTFASCETVPLRWRRAVALAIYTYTRDAELRVLRWSDIDHGIIDVTRAFNRRKPGEVKGTKSDAPRRFSAEPALLPLLDAMRPGGDPEKAGAMLVVNLPSHGAQPAPMALEGRRPARSIALEHRAESAHHLARPAGDRRDVDGRTRRRAP